MNVLNMEMTNRIDRPVKVLQFGEGNFLRGFVDYMIDIANQKGCFDGSIVIVKPIQGGSLASFYKQDCQYTVFLRGVADGEEEIVQRIVTSVSDAVDAYQNYGKYSNYAKLDSLRFIVSNTTEAGIFYDDSDLLSLTPPQSYPGKLTKFLFERYVHFNADLNKGLIILPVELIDDNGIRLLECVKRLASKWELDKGFIEWLDTACVFCSTLVDRIITGYPREDAESLWKSFGYEDRLIVAGEPFALWVIESPKDISLDLPLDKAGLPVLFTDNQAPYRQRKVRILNGAHTSFAMAAYLSGYDYVLEAMQDDLFLTFIRGLIYEEVIPTLDLPKEQLGEFAEAVFDRFNNPNIKHSLLSISLNSISKWKARCMPSLLSSVKNSGKLPVRLAFSLASLMAFYSGGKIEDGSLIGSRNGLEYRIKDDMDVLQFFAGNSAKDTAAFVHSFLSNVSFWGQDLSVLPGADKIITTYLDEIKTIGIRPAMVKLSGGQGKYHAEHS